jgi:hypothetical protein
MRRLPARLPTINGRFCSGQIFKWFSVVHHQSNIKTSGIGSAAPAVYDLAGALSLPENGSHRSGLLRSFNN